MSKLEILCYAVLVAVLIILFTGCDFNSCNSKWKVTLPDGRSCIGSVHYYGQGGTDFHCDNGVIFVNITNANMVRY